MKINKINLSPFEEYMRKRNINIALTIEPSYRQLVPSEKFAAVVKQYNLKDLVTLSDASSMDSEGFSYLVLGSQIHNATYFINEAEAIAIPNTSIPTLRSESKVFLFDLYLNEARQVDFIKIAPILRAPGRENEYQEYFSSIMKNLGEFYYIGWT